jgi:pSer/pThr/pTyr-binding forkhead associated (FHA) protein
MRAQLVAIDGGPSIDLVKDLTLIGRDEDCDIRFDQKSISKLHCVIAKTDGLLLIRDLGSTNGTRVNGQRVRRAALLPNDMLAVANVKYRVMFGVDLEPEPLPDVQPREDDSPETPLQRNALPDSYPESKASTQR